MLFGQLKWVICLCLYIYWVYCNGFALYLSMSILFYLSDNRIGKTIRRTILWRPNSGYSRQTLCLTIQRKRGRREACAQKRLQQSDARGSHWKYSDYGRLEESRGNSHQCASRAKELKWTTRIKYSFARTAKKMRYPKPNKKCESIGGAANNTTCECNQKAESHCSTAIAKKRWSMRLRVVLKWYENMWSIETDNFIYIVHIIQVSYFILYSYSAFVFDI